MANCERFAWPWHSRLSGFIPTTITSSSGQACVAAGRPHTDCWNTLWLRLGDRADCRLVKSKSIGCPRSAMFWNIRWWPIGGRTSSSICAGKHDVSEETSEEASEWRDTFDTVAKRMGHSPLLLVTEGRPADRQDTKDTPKLTLAERRVLVRARRPGARRPPEPHTRTPRFSSDLAAGCVLHSLQSASPH